MKYIRQVSQNLAGAMGLNTTVSVLAPDLVGARVDTRFGARRTALTD